MKKPLKVTLALAALVALASTSALAQPSKRQRSIGQYLAANSGCGTLNEDDVFEILDSTDAFDCDTTGEADPGDWVTAACVCDGGVARPLFPAPLEPDLSPYAPLAGADFTGPVTLTEDRGVAGDEAINFGTFLAEDNAQYRFDFSDSDGDEYHVRSGTDGTAYGLWMKVGTATNNAVLLDIFSGLSLDDDDDGVAEATYSSTFVEVNGVRFVGAFGGPTGTGITCAAGTAGDFYFDNNTENEHCFCNGTNFVKFSDATTVCADPE